MAINHRLVEETARTGGHRADITPAGVVNIYTPTGRLVITGYLTKSGRLTLTSHELRRKMVTLTDLGQALDELNTTPRTVTGEVVL